MATLSDELVYKEIIVNKPNALNRRHPFSTFPLAVLSLEGLGGWESLQGALSLFLSSLPSFSLSTPPPLSLSLSYLV